MANVTICGTRAASNFFRAPSTNHFLQTERPASAMITQGKYKIVFVSAGEQMLCGVGQFTQLLCNAMKRINPDRCMTLTLTRSEGSLADIWRAVSSAQSIVCNFPIVAWKRVIFRPVLALALAKLRRRRVVLVQHEWASLHWLRRITYFPGLLLADTIIMFSPTVRRELAEDCLIGRTATKCVLAPLPPNIETPPGISDSALRRRLASERKQGRLVIGHFGSIYPGKQPNALLDIAAVVRQRGRKPLVVYIGSFITAFDSTEQDFYARLNELGLTDDVIVSGYVASDAEVFGLFGEIDAFCYPLEEGLTARRSSILACVQSGRPVIVTGPVRTDEFDHHPRFKDLIGRGAISLVPPGAPDETYADRILQAVESPTVERSFEFEGWWRDIAQRVDTQL
jgi:glycosyltransferase involved in cell wall biosynthesis